MTTPVALQSGDEVRPTKSKIRAPRSPPVKLPLVPSNQRTDDIDVKKTSTTAPWCARKASSRKASRQDDHKKPSLSPLRCRGGSTSLALRGSRWQDVGSNNGGDAPILTDYVLESSWASASGAPPKTETSDGGYFFPGWSINSEVALALVGPLSPLKHPSSEPHRHPRDAASRSSGGSAVPHMPEELRGPMEMSSSWALQSQMSRRRGAGPQAAQRQMSGSSAVSSTVFGDSQCCMEGSHASSLRFSGLCKLAQQRNEQQQQQQRTMAGIAPPRLNPKHLHPMLLIGPLSDPYRGTVGRCNALQPMRSRLSTVGGAVPATTSPWGDSSKFRSGSIANLNSGHTGDASPLRAPHSSRAMGEASLPMRPAISSLTASQSPLQSFFCASMSTRCRTGICSADKGFNRESMRLPSIYGAGNGGDAGSSHCWGEQETGAAGQSVAGGGYHSFFRSAAGPLPVFECDQNGDGAGDAEKSSRRRDTGHSLYGCMRDEVAVAFSSSSDEEGEEEGGAGEEERGRLKRGQSDGVATGPRNVAAALLQGEWMSARNSVDGRAFESAGQLAPKSSKVGAAFTRQSSLFGSSGRHGDGDAHNSNSDSQALTRTGSCQCYPRGREGTMNARKWMMEAGKDWLPNRKDGTRGDGGSDDGDSAVEKNDNVDGDDDDEHQQRISPTDSSRCVCLERTAHDTDIDFQNMEGVGQSRACSDEDADEGGDGECGPEPQSRHSALEHVVSGMKRLSGLGGADKDVAVQGRQFSLHAAPLLPFSGGSGGGGRGGSSTFRTTCLAVAYNSRPAVAHYCAPPPLAATMLPRGYAGWSTGCGARAAAHLRRCHGCQQRCPSPPKEDDWHEQLTDFISPPTTAGSCACTTPSSGAALATCESPCFIYRQTVTTVAVHELLGLDPESEILRVKSPVWGLLPH
ncbi:hypothetical protein LSCM1_01523 [Leishmania martiniquensis]|uniref:Uncharacterized protein n=1 Tax=Leishmania martiniquensis TaxID=1580590 RepID=A0A836GT87_9TRYP|nr:hypothetical protein LSCM1_01523 [Leishmania martiniquensis]